MPSRKHSTVDVDLALDLDSEEFKRLSDHEPFAGNELARYRGTQEQLIKAGIPLELFPGQPCRPKTLSRFMINGGDAQLYRSQGKNAKHILIWWIPAHLRVIDDPGYDTAITAAPLVSPARFNVGDLCVYREFDETLEITSGFGFYRVNHPAGGFITKEGRRLDYKWGYAARRLGGQPLFYAAHQLAELNGGVRHIRLVGGVRPDTNEIRANAA